MKSHGVVYEKEGKYLRYQDSMYSHDKNKVYITWEEDVNKATVFYSMPMTVALNVTPHITGSKLVAAQETRTVKLLPNVEVT